MKEKNEGRHGPAKRFSRLPPLVVSRAKSAGPAGEKGLDGLDGAIAGSER